MTLVAALMHFFHQLANLLSHRFCYAPRTSFPSVAMSHPTGSLFSIPGFESVGVSQATVQMGCHLFHTELSDQVLF
jgi:hypothetical protein